MLLQGHLARFGAWLATQHKVSLAVQGAASNRMQSDIPSRDGDAIHDLKREIDRLTEEQSKTSRKPSTWGCDRMKPNNMTNGAHVSSSLQNNPESCRKGSDDSTEERLETASIAGY